MICGKDLTVLGGDLPCLHFRHRSVKPQHACRERVRYLLWNGSHPSGRNGRGSNGQTMQDQIKHAPACRQVGIKLDAAD
jgi:hypothetical protein